MSNVRKNTTVVTCYAYLGVLRVQPSQRRFFMGALILTIRFSLRQIHSKRSFGCMIIMRQWVNLSLSI